MPYSIAIAGCGVAGLTAGWLLAKQGHEVTLFEQAAEVGPVGAGILLQPSGQLVLERLGLLDAIVARAARIERLRALTHRGGTLINLAYADVAPKMCAYGLHRGELFSALHQQVKAGGAKIILNRRITSFKNHPEAIEVFDEQEISQGRFDLLLGTDGSRSELRRASGLRAHVHDYPHGALWAQGSCAAIQGELLQVTQGTRQMCGLLPMGGNRCALFWSLEKSAKATLFAAGIDAWKQQVLALAPQAKELLATLHSFNDACFATYLHVHMPQWHAGRFLLLGDAAHSMSPHLGQGINLALLDGLTIAHALATSRAPTEAFALYTRLRRTHTNFYALVTFALSPFFQSRGVIKGWGRDIFLPILPRLPVFGPQMLLAMTGLKASVLGGKMTLPPVSG